MFISKIILCAVLIHQVYGLPSSDKAAGGFQQVFAPLEEGGWYNPMGNKAMTERLLTCRHASAKDDCLPGGKYDPALNRCVGYDGKACFGCYEGSFCDRESGKCMLDTTQGQPVVFQQYWEDVALQRKYGGKPAPCLQLTADYRAEYQFIGGDLVYEPLRKAIMRIHAAVGNAITDGYELVVGHGSTGVMKSAMHALSMQNLGETEFFSRPPCYGKYKSQADSLLTRVSDSKWYAGRWNLAADVDKQNVVEIVTYPNNPDNLYRKPSVHDKNRVIHDCVYLWPQFTNITGPAHEELMIFTASKFTGHAGSRVGWALVKNPVIAQRMREYLIRETIGLNIESQIRVSSVFDYIASEYEMNRESAYSKFAVDVMSENWNSLISVFEKAPEGFELINAKTKGAYAWIRCPEGYHCSELFKDVGLISSPGSGFFVEEHFTRFQMMMRTAEMKSLVKMVHKRLYEMSLPSKDSHEEHLKNSPCHESTACLNRHLP